MRVSEKDLERIAFLRQYFELGDDSQTIRDVLKLMTWYIKRDEKGVQELLSLIKALAE